MESSSIIILPILATALVMTGCAEAASLLLKFRQDKIRSGATTVSTEGLSEDAALNAQTWQVRHLKV